MVKRENTQVYPPECPTEKVVSTLKRKDDGMKSCRRLRLDCGFVDKKKALARCD